MDKSIATADKLNKVGFGYYGVGTEFNTEVSRKLMKSDSVNVMFAYGSGEHLVNQVRIIKELGKTCWLSVYDSVFARDTESGLMVARDDFKENLQQIVKNLSDAGVYDAVRGIYFDEPYLCRVTKETLCRVAGYYRSLEGDRGVFVCFSVGPICPDIWSPDYDIDLLDEETCKYLTDIAYDMYWDYIGNEHVYKKINEKLYEISRNTDIRYWFVPCTMSYLGKSDEDGSIAHANALFEFLKQSKNPGGLMCYSCYTFPPEIEALGNVGLDILFDEKNIDRWSKLEKRLDEIGHSILNEDFR